MPTKELQRRSYAYCVACRDVRTLWIIVNKQMPLSLWGEDESCDGSDEDTNMRRLPAIQAGGVTWNMPTDMLVSVLLISYLLSGVQSMKCDFFSPTDRYRSDRGHSGTGTVVPPTPLKSDIPSPRRLFKAMRHGVKHLISSWNRHHVGTISFRHQARVIDRLLDAVVLPASLLELRLGPCFDRSIYSIVWPVPLVKLWFGDSFNQPVHDKDVVGPSSSQDLSFGFKVDQSLTGGVFVHPLCNVCRSDRTLTNRLAVMCSHPLW